MNITYFAGFVCDYSADRLLVSYFIALILVCIASYLIVRYELKRIKSKPLRIISYAVLSFVALIGWHLLYLVFINGDFLGCPISPLLGV